MVLLHIFSRELLTSGDEKPSSGHQGNALFTMGSGGGSYKTKSVKPFYFAT